MNVNMPHDEAFIFLVLCCSWLDMAQLDSIAYDFTEFFAGQAQVTSCFRNANKAAAALDLDYDEATCRKGGFDLATPAGFASLRLQCAWLGLPG